MRLQPVENPLVQPLLLELEPALPLGGVIQGHIFEIPECAAPTDGAFQALLQTPVAHGSDEGFHIAVTLMRTF